MIPRDRVEARDWIYEREPTITWKLDAPAGRVLAAAWMNLWETLPLAHLEDAPQLAAGFLGLLNGLINPLSRRYEALPAPATTNTVGRAMKRYLGEHLTQPELGVDDLTRVFRCSRATVYRLFPDSGGVTAYIRQCRLWQSFHDLRLAQSSPVSIHEIGARWGFRDHGYFHRAFKKQFGITPTDARGTARQATEEASSLTGRRVLGRIRSVHRWLGNRR